MKLNILICTYNEGIRRVKSVISSYRSDVSYIVSHQCDDDNHVDIPEELQRKDVQVFTLHGRGLSKNRNHTLALADADIAIIADDDVCYNDEYFDRIIETYKSDQNLDVCLFKIKTKIGQPEYKIYPERSFIIKNVQKHFISSIEITFRVKKIREHRIWFDERFGLGSKYLIGGEEKVFVADCEKNGLVVKYLPYYVVEHPYESFNRKIEKFDKRRIRTDGALDMRLNGIISLLRAFYIVTVQMPRMIKNGRNPFHFFWHRLFGAGVILFFKMRSS